MNNFDLKRVHDLIMYQDLCTTDNEYMTEASSIQPIELETEALYEINPQLSLLFTTKLRYYRLLIEKEINRHINDAIQLIEADNTEQMTKFVLKKTREAVTTLLNEANRQIAIFDNEGMLWKCVSSGNPVSSTFCKSSTEYIVYLHYLFAELTRCWLELQDRYAYVIGQAGCYDVALFYTSNLKRNPDKEFEVKRSEKYVEESKGFRKCRTDCCFLYDNEEYFAIAIQEFTNKLKSYKLIPEKTDYLSMMSLFRGHPCRRKYIWLGKNHILTHIIKGLMKGEKPIISAWPQGTSKWDIVSCRFVDKENNPLPNIKSEKEREGTKEMIKDIIGSLAGYI